MTATTSEAQSKNVYRRGESLQSVGTNNSSNATSERAASWDNDVMAAASDQLFFVTSYSDFNKLAHGPRGTEAKKSLYVYRFHPSDGSLLLLNVQGDPADVVNPAFSRHHPRLNVVYTCTEDIDNNGHIYAYAISRNGELRQLGEAVDAGGTSTCYLTFDKSQKHMLAVNYWDSTLAVIPMNPETGEFTGPIKNIYDPKQGQKMVAAGRVHGGVNHSCNDESTIRMRQADPHSHALVLDPFVGAVAYVPDLGKDLIREFYYDRCHGKIEMELNVLPSGLCTGMPDGPRYFEFHPKYNVAYVVNELSSTIAVFEVDRALLNEISQASISGTTDMSRFKGRSTLRLIQSIKTIPAAFPTEMNTCGRICVHKSGRFVIVSNRGHQSITVFRVQSCGSSSKRGELTAVGYYHTRGETPRHFQFDASGQYLLVANQDTDSIAVFNFNLSSGEIKYTGNEYRVPSPNFVCSCPVYGDDEDEYEMAIAATSTNQLVFRAMDQSRELATAGTMSDSECSADGASFPSTTLLVPPKTLADPSTAEDSTSVSKEAMLEAELAHARKEIEDLKKQLTAMANSTSHSSEILQSRTAE